MTIDVSHKLRDLRRCCFTSVQEHPHRRRAVSPHLFVPRGVQVLQAWRGDHQGGVQQGACSAHHQPTRSLTAAQYRGGAFRIANHNRWHIVVTGPQLIEELKKAPDDVLSFNEAIKEVRADPPQAALAGLKADDGRRACT